MILYSSDGWMDIITRAAEFVVASLTDGIVFLNHFGWRPRLEDFVDSVQPPPLERLSTLKSFSFLRFIDIVMVLGYI